MPVTFKLVEPGEGIKSVDVLEILIKEGDTLTANQAILQVQADKATTPITCPHAGKVTKIHVSLGDKIDVGAPILDVETGAGAAKSEPAPAKAEPAASKPAPAPSHPELKPSATAPQAPAATQAPAAKSLVHSDNGPIPAGPASRREARELGIDLRYVQGSGKRGRITPEDVRASATSPAPSSPAAAAPASTPSASPKPAPAKVEVPPGEASRDAFGPTKVAKLAGIRRAIADQMHRSWSIIPRVTNMDDVDVTDLERLRQGVPPDQFGANVKLTMMPFIMKAVALALKQRPTVNASIDLDKNQIIYKQYVHLGIAVDTPNGLVVPVIRDVDRMTIPEIARALSNTTQRVRSSQFSIEDLKGGSFTISNLGAVGGTYSTPIINYPEVAILLLGRSRKMPVVVGDDDRVEVRLMMPLSISYDHRLVDGAEAARFLALVKNYLGNPGSLLLAE